MIRNPYGLYSEHFKSGKERTVHCTGFKIDLKERLWDVDWLQESQCAVPQ